MLFQTSQITGPPFSVTPTLVVADYYRLGLQSSSTVERGEYTGLLKEAQTFMVDLPGACLGMRCADLGLSQ